MGHFTFRLMIKGLCNLLCAEKQDLWSSFTMKLREIPFFHMVQIDVELMMQSKKYL
jgi:hypothetical protein